MFCFEALVLLLLQFADDPTGSDELSSSFVQHRSAYLVACTNDIIVGIDAADQISIQQLHLSVEHPDLTAELYSTQTI